MRKILLFLILLQAANLLQAKDKKGYLVDKVEIIVDNNIVLHSDIENQLLLMAKELKQVKDPKCYLAEQLIINKVMTSQAILDSIPLTDEEVDQELDKKINYYVNMLGSKKAFEDYYDKPIEAIKEDFRDDIRDQMLAQRMRSKIVENLTVTPTEVRDFYNKIPKDSLPFYNTEYEISEIAIYVKIGKEQQELALNKALEIKKRLDNGEDFALLATLYSEDPGSASNGGELGLMPRGSFVPEFEAAAYKLKDGEISDIVKTQFGYHIIKLNKRIGDQIDCSHILIRTQPANKDIEYAQKKADSVRTAIINGSISFFNAVKEYSDDEMTKGNGGRVMNYQTGGTIMEPEQMDPNLFKLIEALPIDSLSKVEAYQTHDGKFAFRFAKVDSKVDPHVANLSQDYTKIMEAAKAEKEQKTIQDWLAKKSKKTYIFINEELRNCPEVQQFIQDENN